MLWCWPPDEFPGLEALVLTMYCNTLALISDPDLGEVGVFYTRVSRPFTFGSNCAQGVLLITQINVPQTTLHMALASGISPGCLMLLSVIVSSAAAQCPAGWMGGTPKCMKLIAADTHHGCEASCGAMGGSLACLQNQNDVGVAQMVQVVASGGVPDLSAFVWTGEYQYPPEPYLRANSLSCMNQPMGCNGNAMGFPYNNQAGWGKCSNGQLTTFSPSIMGFAQPNNYNGAEDCMATTLAGLADSPCSVKLPCLCEHGSSSSADYLNVHGPALKQKAIEATALVNSNLIRTLILAIIIGSIPALLCVLVIEGYYVRWQQRMAPTTADEAKLQSTIKKGLRRRMVQTGLSLWLGGVLFAFSIPPRTMFADGSWPNDGVGYWPYGMPIFWDGLREPGILFIMLTILPSDEAAIRTLAVAWPVYAFVVWYVNTYVNVPTWIIAPRPEPQRSILANLRWVALALALWAALPDSSKLPAALRKRALPGRIALRVLWISIRLEVFVGALEYLYDSLPYLDLPFNFPELVGWPMIWPPVIRMIFAVLMNEYVRRFITGLFGGCGNKGIDSSAAAVVQTMVSGDALEALREAHGRLHCIHMSTLGEADMANNQDSGLFSKTVKVGPGDCDAFLSHSWRDDPQLKWQRMLEYKKEFEDKNGGKEPYCWLDKVCAIQRWRADAGLLLHSVCRPPPLSFTPCLVTPCIITCLAGVHRPGRRHQQISQGAAHLPPCIEAVRSLRGRLVLSPHVVHARALHFCPLGRLS